MRMKTVVIPGTALLAALAIGALYNTGEASDHDDGEQDIKSRALNLTDHFAFKSGNDLSLVMYFNPRSLPGRQYSMSTNARYEFHVSKAVSKTSAPTAKDDYVFRFEAKAPDASGIQETKLTILKDGTEIGSQSGSSTAFGKSKANDITTNQGTVGGMNVKWFIGQRADSFHFDVVRFFQVRAFLAARFFGGQNGNGDPTATLADNCRGDKFLLPVLGMGGEVQPSDGDLVNLFNPPSCAPDFTKDLNVTAIVLNVPLSALEGTVFDTWSTISVGE